MGTGGENWIIMDVERKSQHQNLQFPSDVSRLVKANEIGISGFRPAVSFVGTQLLLK